MRSTFGRSFPAGGGASSRAEGAHAGSDATAAAAIHASAAVRRDVRPASTPRQHGEVEASGIRSGSPGEGIDAPVGGGIGDAA